MKNFLPFFFTMIVFCTQSFAQEEAKSEYVGVKLMSAYDAVGKQPVIDMGLGLSLAPEWYTYWRMAGDNGVAPVFDSKNSTNVKSFEILWPTPERITISDMSSFGYRHDLIFPLIVTPEKIGEDVNLDLDISVMVCHDICVPQKLHVSKNISAGKTKSTEFFQAIHQARTTLPSKDNLKNLGIDTAALGKDSVVVSAYTKGGFKEEDTDLVIETSSSLLTARPEIIPDEKNKDRAILKIKAPQGSDLSRELFGKTTTILLTHGHEAIERPFSF